MADNFTSAETFTPDRGEPRIRVSTDDLKGVIEQIDSEIEAIKDAFEADNQGFLTLAREWQGPKHDEFMAYIRDSRDQTAAAIEGLRGFSAEMKTARNIYLSEEKDLISLIRSGLEAC